MPWNDNADPGGKPGPWGSPPDEGKPKPQPKPEPKRAGGGPRRPSTPPGGPDFDDIMHRLGEQARRILGSGGGGGRLEPRAIGAVVAGLVGLWLLSGIYMVQPNEQAVVTTFGAYSRSEGPGLRYHLPLPVERVEKVPFTNLNRMDIGGVPGADIPAESLMLTGDENIVDLNFTVQWRVADAADFVFNTREPEDTIKAVAESAMREVIGKTALQPILTNGRGQVQDQAAALMQKVLDGYKAGVFIDAVQIRDASPPSEVIDAFRDVARAQQDAESAVNVANGEAAKVRQAALGYKAQVVHEAAGEAARFNQVYEQYKAAPAVTRQRLYIETMQKVLQKSNKVIVDTHGASTPVVLPPDVFKSKTPQLTLGQIPVVRAPAPAQGGDQ